MTVHRSGRSIPTVCQLYDELSIRLYMEWSQLNEIRWLNVDLADIHKSFFGFHQRLLSNAVSLYRSSSGLASGVVLEVGNNGKREGEESDGSGEEDFRYSPFVRHLKWPLWILFCLVGCGFLSSGIWLCTEGQFLKGVVLMIPGAVCAVVGTVILCVYF
jgi:hypothetical protein